MLEAPSPGWGEVNLTGQDDLDMIGRVFRGEPGPVVMPDVTPKVVAIPSAVAAGLIVKKTAPMYPRDAKEARISGQVLLEATISATGSIESLHVLKGPDTLRQAAIDAVSKWRFKPYMLNDKPTAAEFMVGVSFTLADDGVFYR
jgi:protein TonB